MIKVTDIAKSYGEQILFSGLNFTINRGERIGLVGRNGYGKTTLFRILCGSCAPDSGEISIPRNYKIGHLEQQFSFTQHSILAEGIRSLNEEEKDDHWKVEKILSGLGFSKEDMQKPPSLFSGGYQIRLNLAKLLIARPDLILLDEPNNYLDIIAIRWLSTFLRSWRGELMLITHDRNFMDSVTTHTMVIHRQKARKIEGGTEKLYHQIAHEEEIHEKTRVNEEKKRKQTELFIRRFRAKARLAGMVQSRIKCLEKQEKKEQLEKLDTLDFSFHYASFPTSHMMSARTLTFSYERKEPYLINKFSLEVDKGERICIIGKNGRGKSTLLKLLASELFPVSGHIRTHPEVKLGYFSQTNVAQLNDNRTIYEEIMSADNDCLPQRARTICGTMMFGGDAALKKIAVLSGGEKSRVLLGKVLTAPCNLLLLDEPTNHLDLESCEAVMEALEEFEGSVIMVTHNETYLHRLAKRLVVFDGADILHVDGTYQDFLDKIGWQDEKNAARLPVSNRNDDERRALKKIKAELLQEKARVLKPFEVEIKRYEDSITARERELHEATELLVAASTSANAPEIARLSKISHHLRKEIDELYDRLDGILPRYEENCRKYRKRFDEIEERSTS